jgi:hypothetical protein
LGQEVGDFVEIPSMAGVRVMMVPLSERETQLSVIYASQLPVDDNQAGVNARNRACVQHDVWQATREPGNLSTHLWENVDSMLDELEPEDVDALADALVTLMDYASPAIDGISEEELDNLKKASDQIRWNGLTGRRWAVVKLYLSVMSPELLAASFSGSISTAKSTTTSESEEST